MVGVGNHWGIRISIKVMPDDCLADFFASPCAIGRTTGGMGKIIMRMGRADARENQARCPEQPFDSCILARNTTVVKIQGDQRR